jgi:hypothetical protein
MTPDVSTIDALRERIERDGSASLTEPERFYYSLWVLEAAVNNGGFESYFSSVSIEDAKTAAAAPDAVGAAKMSAILRAAIAMLKGPTKIPTQFSLNAKSASEQKWLDSLSRQFTDYPDNLRQLIAAYVGTHEGAFKGPRSTLELWQSRRARSASTEPKRVTVLLSKSDEAKRDAQFSTRACPQCGYPSPDYRRTCKQCGFPHGAVQ